MYIYNIYIKLNLAGARVVVWEMESCQMETGTQQQDG